MSILNNSFVDISRIFCVSTCVLNRILNAIYQVVVFFKKVRVITVYFVTVHTSVMASS